MKLCWVLLFTLLNFPGKAGQPFLQTITPHYAQLQFAGNIGLFSAGVGYNLFRDRLHVSLLDGFTPANIAGSNINTLAIKTGYDIAIIPGNKKITLLPYVGLGGTFETTGNGVYLELAERYPDGYYKLSAAHLIGFAGAKLQVPVGRRQHQRIELYGETGTIDTYAYYFIRNGNIKFTEIFSGAIGVTWHFGRKGVQ